MGNLNQVEIRPGVFHIVEAPLNKRAPAVAAGGLGLGPLQRGGPSPARRPLSAPVYRGSPLPGQQHC